MAASGQQASQPTDQVSLGARPSGPRLLTGATLGGATGLAASALLSQLGWVGQVGAAAVGAIAGAAIAAATAPAPAPAPKQFSLDEIRQMPEQKWVVPTRTEQLERLKSGEEFDVLVIGGGATGAGATLEAARRGLKVACVEAGDFASGTSSKSTKLIHGGVRYLEKAVKKLDAEQYGLVKEGLHERKAFLEMAPHLTDEIRLITPVYSYAELPYFYAGLWLYDRIAGQAGLEATKMLSARAVKERLPEVKSEGLRGGVAYSDGQFNDSRMNVGLATTAAAQGAAVANYVKVLDLVKEDGQVVGARVQDTRSDETFTVRAKTVINATGPFIDGIRKMDDPQTPELVVPSAGTHVFVDKLKMREGLLVPEAPNGSVAFFKPFEGGTLIGTTEEKTEITTEPRTSEEHVKYLIDLANGYLDPDQQIGRSDVTSVWTGIRPLVRDPHEKVKPGATASISRKHIIDVSDSGLITIGGGKWTSFGRMGEEVVQEAVEHGHLEAQPSQRASAKLIGAHGFSESLTGQLEQSYGLAHDVADHLAHNYGDRALAVADLAKEELGERLAPNHPYLEAEVVYACKHEYATTPVDVLSRRTRLSFIDEKATVAALGRTVDLMAETLGWSDQQKARELEQAQAFYARNNLA